MNLPTRTYRRSTPRVLKQFVGIHVEQREEFWNVHFACCSKLMICQESNVESNGNLAAFWPVTRLLKTSFSARRSASERTRKVRCHQRLWWPPRHAIETHAPTQPTGNVSVMLWSTDLHNHPLKIWSSLQRSYSKASEREPSDLMPPTTSPSKSFQPCPGALTSSVLMCRHGLPSYLVHTLLPYLPPHAAGNLCVATFPLPAVLCVRNGPNPAELGHGRVRVAN
mmetsp:Transcript_16278/g.33025  ORF Transcript_16278/g.33025 Transcript_16278/m.33025 type:complete len:224 (+) Transcript_16278:4839-5510(+)